VDLIPSILGLAGVALGAGAAGAKLVEASFNRKLTKAQAAERDAAAGEINTRAALTFNAVLVADNDKLRHEIEAKEKRLVETNEDLTAMRLQVEDLLGRAVLAEGRLQMVGVEAGHKCDPAKCPMLDELEEIRQIAMQSARERVKNGG
jgi:hypothetical protein